jgi:hypothetical protein
MQRKSAAITYYSTLSQSTHVQHQATATRNAFIRQIGPYGDASCASICDASSTGLLHLLVLHAKRFYHHNSRRTDTYCDDIPFKEEQLMTTPGPQHLLVQQGQVTLPQSASNWTSVVLLLLLWVSWQNGTVPCNRLPSSLVLFNDAVKDRSDAGMVPVS